MNKRLKYSFLKKIFVSIIIIVILLIIFYFSFKINKKQHILIEKILPFSLDLRFFNNTEKQFLDIEKTHLYKIPDKYKISTFPNSVRVFEKDGKINWVVTVYNKRNKKLFNGQEFDDVVISENNKDYLLINGDFIYFEDKKILNNKDTVYNLHSTGKFAFFTYLNGNSVLNIDNYIFALKKGYKVKKIFFSDNGKRNACFLEKENEFFILNDNGEYKQIDGNVKEIVFSPDNKDIVYLVEKDNYQSLYLNNSKIGDFLKIKNISFSKDGRFFSFLIKEINERGDYHFFINGNIMYSNIKNSDFFKFSENGDFLFTSFKFFKSEENTIFSINDKELFKGTNFSKLEIEKNNLYYSTIFKRDGDDFLIINGRGLVSLPQIRDYSFDDDWTNIAYTGALKKDEREIFYPFPFKITTPYDYSFFLNNVPCEDKYDFMGNCIYSAENNSFYTIGVKEKNIYLLKAKNPKREKNTKYSKKVDYIKELENIAEISQKFNFNNIEKFKIDYIAPDSLQDIKQHNLIAEIHIANRNNNFKETIELCKRYIKIFGNDNEIIRILYKNLYSYEAYEESLYYVEFLLETFSDEYELLKIKADILYKLSRKEESIVVFEYLLNKFNEPIEILNNLAGIYFDGKKIALAEKYANKAIKKEKHSFESNYILGSIFFERQVFYKAEIYFNNCLKVSKNNWEIYKMLALVKESYSQFDDAVDFIDKAIKINRKSVELVSIRAMLNYKNQNLKSAIQDMYFVIEYDFTERNILTLSDFLFEDKQYKQVFELLEKGIDKYSKKEQLYNQIANFLIMADNSKYRDGKKAVIYARKAYKLKPILYLKDTLATAYAEAGFYKDAIILQQEIVKESNLAIYKEKLEVFKSGMTWYEYKSFQK
ncbi:MAG: hypothetical protein M0R46_14230 [Candidatus Muirbacterium halophilum]|nr:hypothetical protein [Candidatus Muirbacterium halophilum]MCK9477079.1 hypothetical protein [Candidatus Muirbacterium halophilum]